MFGPLGLEQILHLGKNNRLADVPVIRVQSAAIVALSPIPFRPTRGKELCFLPEPRREWIH